VTKELSSDFCFPIRRLGVTKPFPAFSWSFSCSASYFYSSAIDSFSRRILSISSSSSMFRAYLSALIMTAFILSLTCPCTFIFSFTMAFCTPSLDLSFTGFASFENFACSAYFLISSASLFFSSCRSTYAIFAVILLANLRAMPDIPPTLFCFSLSSCSCFLSIRCYLCEIQSNSKFESLISRSLRRVCSMFLSSL